MLRLARAAVVLAACVVITLRLHAQTRQGSESLTMVNAEVLLHECLALSQQGRGQNYDEFGLVVESTHGTWRRTDTRQTLTAEYRVTPQGVLWDRRVAALR